VKGKEKREGRKINANRRRAVSGKKSFFAHTPPLNIISYHETRGKTTHLLK
jgi:hypothetical protein